MFVICVVSPLLPMSQEVSSDTGVGYVSGTEGGVGYVGGVVLGVFYFYWSAWSRGCVPVFLFVRWAPIPPLHCMYITYLGGGRAYYKCYFVGVSIYKLNMD